MQDLTSKRLAVFSVPETAGLHPTTVNLTARPTTAHTTAMYRYLPPYGYTDCQVLGEC